MAAEKKILVRHTHTSEVREVTAEERDNQDKNFWVRITGDVKPTPAETEAPAETSAPKTTSKADAPSK